MSLRLIRGTSNRLTNQPKSFSLSILSTFGDRERVRERWRRKEGERKRRGRESVCVYGTYRLFQFEVV